MLLFDIDIMWRMHHADGEIPEVVFNNRGRPPDAPDVDPGGSIWLH